MLDLSPTKVLIVLVVVVILLGPKRIPEVARQLGAGWRKLRDLHGQIDRELRQTMPDLPSSQEIVRMARSPLSLLSQLADRSDTPSGDTDALAASQDGGWDADPPTGAASFGAPPGAGAQLGPLRPGRPRWAGEGTGGVASVRPPSGLDADDPNLN